MTDVKLTTKVTAAVQAGIAPHIPQMWHKQDGRWIAIVELKHVRREEPGVGEDQAAAVKLGLTHCEVAAGDHEAGVRELLAALYKLRTAQGTLDDTQVLERQVVPDRIRWAVDTLLWPPQPGDVWTAGDDGEPYFAHIGPDGDVHLMDSTGEVRKYMEVFAEHERMDLKARRRVKRGDDSA